MMASFSFCPLSTSVLLLFPNYSKWFPGFTFHITFKKMVPRNYYVYFCVWCLGTPVAARGHLAGVSL